MDESADGPTTPSKSGYVGCNVELVENKNHGGPVSELVFGLKHGLRCLNLDTSRVSMSVSVVSTTAIDDALFTDYAPTTAFLFPGQNNF
ncbi:hypothetical protein L1987_20181 [Smallanthus sonchifolius]|uniref:Uncharacterized protein n=1 Tax=Smallanthus sonchifolius TaxID=185202 RepID=A0ACB9IR41_9ASTR|nr:hypothetical protein L1987_20181 [Smallanthus sonchifolius]